MDFVESRVDSDRAPDASDPAAAADEVRTEVDDGGAPATADEVGMEVPTGSAAAAANGATEARVAEAAAEGFDPEQVRAVASSVSDQKMQVHEGGALGGDHSAVRAASTVNADDILGEVKDLAPVASGVKMEVDEGDVASQENSAAPVVNQVNARRLAPVVSESKMEVDDARILEEEPAAAPMESGVKMEEGDGRVLNQEAATPATTLPIKEEARECLVGRYIGKTVSRHGRIFMGKVASYDSTTNAYNAVFEDGHGEDLGLSQLQQLLMAEDNGASGMKVSCRKRKLDLLVSSGGGSDVKAPPRTSQRVHAGEMSTRPDVLQRSGSGSDASEDTATSSKSSDFTKETPSDPCPPVQAVELPPSSGDIAVPEESISYLFCL
jgi:hypothetical protein